MDSILTEKIDMYDVWTHSTQCHTDTVWLLTFILKFSLNSNVYSPARVLQKYLHRVWTIENDEHLNDRLSLCTFNLKLSCAYNIQQETAQTELCQTI